MQAIFAPSKIDIDFPHCSLVRHCEHRQKREKVRACTPKCLPSPKRFAQAGVTARRRGYLDGQVLE
jgi:hypothetical protein